MNTWKVEVRTKRYVARTDAPYGGTYVYTTNFYYSETKPQVLHPTGERGLFVRINTDKDIVVLEGLSVDFIHVEEINPDSAAKAREDRISELIKENTELREALQISNNQIEIRAATLRAKTEYPSPSYSYSSPGFFRAYGSYGSSYR